ncbi:hypothetical protein MOQ_003647 [Trypanosoma cruzi marinkellei]|uniref:Geranylgeranyl transferase type-2 subunit alpha n=1 Tax=Trypanosoma cruzi marinkellei TaxID=85056 RepID=K2NU60_TRYCR|nr:hypothetical protein MOQ_003647 [Trypanosoma cruzi marinkellei]
MHDQRKVRQEVDEKTREKRLAEVQAFTSAYGSLLRKRDDHVYSEAVLQQLSELLQKNPEAYSMYNYRRIALLHLWGKMREEKVGPADATENTTQVGGDTATGGLPSSQSDETKRHAPRGEIEWLKDELKLSSTILISDYKVYAAFMHRRWIFAQLERLAKDALYAITATDTAGAAVQSGSDRVEHPEELRFWSSALTKEKKQCDMLLAADERNFHAWNYRRWILSEIARMEKLLAQYSIDLNASASKNTAEEQVPAMKQQQQEEEEEQQKLKPQSCGGSGGNDGEPCGSFFIPEELKEMRFTTTMLRRNFSNYSAWHQRGVIINTALQRLQERSDDNVTRDVALKEAWGQLEEDLEFFITAVYCDPADQSAWYYIQFLIRAANTLESISPAHHAVRLEFTTRPIQACIEILGEEKRLGDEAEAYWPRYYLFTVLLASFGAGKSNSDGKNKARAAVMAFASEIRKVLCPNDSPGDSREIEEDCVWCLRELAAELVRADPLRSGMYKSLLARVTS